VRLARPDDVLDPVAFLAAEELPGDQSVAAGEMVAEGLHHQLLLTRLDVSGEAQQHELVDLINPHGSPVAIVLSGGQAREASATESTHGFVRFADLQRSNRFVSK
jgi:hypothetical protein